MDMIKRGLSKARANNKPFLPAPGEFCEWCKPSPIDVGLPSCEEAFRHAREECGKHADIRNWKHDAVYSAARSVGFFDLKTTGDNDKTFSSLRKRFFNTYELIVERVINGEDVCDSIVKLPKPEKYTKTSKIEAAAEDALSSLRSMFDE